MGATRITAPAGMGPRTDPTLLAPNQAQEASNCVLTDGRIRALNAPLYVGSTAKSGPLRTIYRIRNDAGVPHWLSWNKTVSVVRGPLAGDKRYYYTGDGEPRMTTVGMALQSGLNNYPSHFFALGVPAPKTVPEIAGVTGGEADSNESRTYLTTYVTQFGEESAPSDPSEVVAGKPDGTWALSFADTGPANEGTVESMLIDTSNDTATLTMSVAEGKYPVFRVGAEIDIAGATGLTELNGRHEIRDVPADDKVVIAFRKSRDNLVLHSVFSPEHWRTNALGGDVAAVVTPNYGTAPDGSNDTAFMSVESPGTACTSPGNEASQEFFAGQKYVAAIHVRLSSLNKRVALRMPSAAFADGLGVAINLATGEVEAEGNAEEFGFIEGEDGIVRIWIAQTATASVKTYAPRLCLKDSFAPGEGVEFWGMSVNEGSVPAEYRKTTGGVYDEGSASFAMTAPWNVVGLKRRIYRLVSGDTTDNFMLVDEIDATQTTYEDRVTKLTDMLMTRGWRLPPGNLRALKALPNAAVAGIAGNMLCVSVPGYPHAWPVEHQHALDDEAVAISPFDRSIAVATKSMPVIATGVDPSQLSLDKVEESLGCLGEATAASFSFGMIYSSKRGLVLIGSGGLQLAAPDLWTEREWKEIGPETIRAVAHDNRLYALFQPSPDVPSRMFVLDRNGPASLIEVGISADAIYSDPDGELFIAIGNSIFQWDANEGERLQYYWRSKEFVFPRGATVGALSIEADWTMTPSEAAAARAAFDEQVRKNAEIMQSNDILNGAMNWTALNAASVNGSDIPDVPAASFDALNITLFCDGESIFSIDAQDDYAISAPDGYKAKTVSIAVGGNVPCRAILFGEDKISLGMV